jgi:hypothetical protein
MAQQDCISVALVESAPRFVGDDDLIESDTGVEREGPRERQELTVADGVTGMPGAARRQ